uniref:Robl_LC7 domain-containing protein n=1 Tax=Heterorhabditis bacteriophora TaxID=37862 RepID=A0A1I7X4F8_HETBA
MVRPKNCNSTENSQLTDQPGNMENHDDITKELTQYVLCSASNRGYCKELELRKLLDITTNEFQSAMIDANKRLQEVAGCQVSILIINSSGRSYVVNMLNHSEEFSESDNIQEDAKNGLLTVILIFIFMAKKPLVENANVTDTMLWDFLAGVTTNFYSSRKIPELLFF